MWHSELVMFVGVHCLRRTLNVVCRMCRSLECPDSLAITIFVSKTCFIVQDRLHLYQSSIAYVVGWLQLVQCRLAEYCGEAMIKSNKFPLFWFNWTSWSRWRSTCGRSQCASTTRSIFGLREGGPIAGGWVCDVIASRVPSPRRLGDTFIRRQWNSSKGNIRSNDVYMLFRCYLEKGEASRWQRFRHFEPHLCNGPISSWPKMVKWGNEYVYTDKHRTIRAADFQVVSSELWYTASV